MASIAKRPDGQWRARYRDSSGREHSKHFARKTDAQRWLDEVTAAIVTGQYVDPRSGRITFREYAERWRSAQMHRPSTENYIERQLRRHAYPILGDRPVSSIMPSDVQVWTKRLAEQLAPSTVGVVHGIVSGIFRTAVRNRVIASNPCDDTKLPKVDKPQIQPLPTDVVHRLADAIPDRYRALVILAAGTGMRQGECFGLSVDRVNFLRREVRVDRQLVYISRQRPSFGPPKTPKSERIIPLPQVVIDALAAHLAAYPPGPDGLIFTTAAGEPIRRTSFGGAWRPTVKAAGAPIETGFHDLRHYYASLLIRHGESVKVVQARLGHASASETLDTYSHLWPDSDDRTRSAVDSVLLADSVRTEEVINGQSS
jgi:integrase